MTCHDPLVDHWPGIVEDLPASLPAADGFDAVVFAVPHREYPALDLGRWLGAARPLLLDANNVLTDAQLAAAPTLGCRCYGIGRGAIA